MERKSTKEKYFSLKKDLVDYRKLKMCGQLDKDRKCYKVDTEKKGLVSRLFSYGHFYWQYTHETLVPSEVISSGCNALVIPFQQLLGGPMEVL